jgi:beta-glucosidase
MAGRSYKYFQGQPLFAFGHGLSYTHFEYGEPRVEGTMLLVSITNAGGCDGAEVVQVYARDLQAGVERPQRQLIGFLRQEISAGQTVEVSVPLEMRLLRRRDEKADAFVYDQTEWMLEVGSSSDHPRSSTVLGVTECSAYNTERGG